MEPRALTTDETVALRELVDSGIATALSTPGAFAYAPGGLYRVTWSLGSLDASGIERVAWLLGQLGFSVGDIDTRSVPSDLGGVANEFYTVLANRRLTFLPDSLMGEALIIESVAAIWETHIDSFDLPSDGQSHRVALASLLGPFGLQIM